MAATLLAGASLDNTLGAVFIGFALSMLLVGLFIAQVYRYYVWYPNDRGFYHVLVAGVAVLVFIDEAFIAHAVYYYIVKNYANPLAIITHRIIWTLIVQIMVGAIVGAIVRSCFAMRVWRFSGRNIPVTFIILALTLGHLGCAAAYTAYGFRVPTLAQVAFSKDLKTWATLSLSFGASTDIITALALCWYLRRLRSGYHKSDSMIKNLTLFAVNTGIVTSTLSLGTLLLFDLMPNNFIYMGVYFILCKVYAISFMAALNSRKIMRGRGTEQEDQHRNTPSTGNTFRMMGMALNGHHVSHVSGDGKSMDPMNTIIVHVDEETMVSVDDVLVQSHAI